MAERFVSDNRRYVEQSERSFSESIIGGEYTMRVYARHNKTARGTVMLGGSGECRVHNAYMLCESDTVGHTVTGTAVGVLIDKRCGGISIILAENDRMRYQYELAEAVDYWERLNDNKIYCLREKSCGAVVFTEVEGVRQYLVIRMNLGHCGLPKGHIEKYESETQTAIREVREETGVEITLIDGFCMTVEYSLTSKTKKESVYFLGRFSGDSVKIQEAEVSSYRLCDYETARRLITYENDRAVLDAAEERLKQSQNG